MKWCDTCREQTLRPHHRGSSRTRPRRLWWRLVESQHLGCGRDDDHDARVRRARLPKRRVHHLPETARRHDPGVRRRRCGAGPAAVPEGVASAAAVEAARAVGADSSAAPGLTTQQRAAFTACQSKLPGGGRFGGRGFAGGANASQLKAYMSCLSDNGVKVPTTAPVPGGAAGGSGPRRFGNPIAGLRNDPHFAAASAKCAPLLPSAGSRAPTSAAG